MNDNLEAETIKELRNLIERKDRQFTALKDLLYRINDKGYCEEVMTEVQKIEEIE